MRHSGWVLKQCCLWCLLPAHVNCGVDIGRAILYPETFEESLCAYVVAIFIGGWIIVLTAVISYWMWYRVPVPRYTYKLVTGTGEAERTIKETGVLSNKGDRLSRRTTSREGSGSDESPLGHAILRMSADGDNRASNITTETTNESPHRLKSVRGTASLRHPDGYVTEQPTQVVSVTETVQGKDSVE